MHKPSYYIVNGITLYRLVASFFLLYLVFHKQIDVFKWLLAFSFFTDALDGYLARKYNAISVFGSKIDSIADDLTVLVAFIGIIVLMPGFVQQEMWWIIALFILYIAQLIFAFVRYRKMTGFHTWLAKIAAVLQGGFLILIFFLKEWPLALFYIVAIVTMLDIAEEIVMVALLPEWRSDVKGIWWIKNDKGKK